MLIKSVFIIAFIVIVFSLGSALFHLVTRKEQEVSDKTAKALTVRIGLSILLFILVFIAMSTGLIEPHGIGVRIQQIHHQNEIDQPQL